jgi:hypothetical protein
VKTATTITRPITIMAAATGTRATIRTTTGTTTTAATENCNRTDDRRRQHMHLLTTPNLHITRYIPSHPQQSTTNVQHAHYTNLQTPQQKLSNRTHLKQSTTLQPVQNYISHITTCYHIYKHSNINLRTTHCTQPATQPTRITITRPQSQPPTAICNTC